MLLQTFSIFIFAFFLQLENFAFFPFSYTTGGSPPPSLSLTLTLSPCGCPNSLPLVKATPPSLSLPVFPREKASYEYEIGKRTRVSETWRGTLSGKKKWGGGNFHHKQCKRKCLGKRQRCFKILLYMFYICT
jgi:hypothetical protein